jgi:GMP reductase
MEIFDYDNILLLPRKCRVESRSECDTSIEFGGRRFALPVVPSNMKTVLDEPIASTWPQRPLLRDAPLRPRQRGLRAAHARAGPVRVDQLGRQAADFEVIDRLAAEGVGADYITIDIAHGHADSVRKTIEHIKTRLPQAFVIAGNVATPEAVIDLENWGADATKVGVGPGKVCITKLKTGFGTGGWQLSALKWCARVATKPIIADGGIRHHGDIAKSVRFGAAMVMIGSLFAGHEESPGRHGRGRRQAVQGVLRLGQRLQQGRVQARRGQAHPRADQGPAGRHAARDARGPAELDQLRRRARAGRPEEGQLRDPGRRERRRAPVHVRRRPAAPPRRVSRQAVASRRSAGGARAARPA